LKDQDVVDLIVQSHPIDLKIGGVLAMAGRVEPLASLRTRRRREKTVLWWCDRTGNEQGELQNLAAIEGDVLDCPAIDDLPKGHRSLDRRHVRDDVDRFRDITDLQLKVLNDRSTYLDHEPREDRRA